MAHVNETQIDSAYPLYGCALVKGQPMPGFSGSLSVCVCARVKY